MSTSRSSQSNQSSSLSSETPKFSDELLEHYYEILNNSNIDATANMGHHHHMNQTMDPKVFAVLFRNKKYNSLPKTSFTSKRKAKGINFNKNKKSKNSKKNKKHKTKKYK